MEIAMLVVIISLVMLTSYLLSFIPFEKMGMKRKKEIFTDSVENTLRRKHARLLRERKYIIKTNQRGMI